MEQQKHNQDILWQKHTDHDEELGLYFHYAALPLAGISNCLARLSVSICINWVGTENMGLLR